ncbi:MAG: CsgG/HfaB family protein [Candidatus Omnitrophica bacterium]|nr:CsgG/HfaB family protein [Candidatus Omnitrophota bacterium]MBU1048091.1 CsgG/HfaB family protein [Candidatus Omnitrophota bacterium]MBU1631418.1 CsgG/HfaB family protein [Candidatus Omnitrophota bacterium]MBU1766646.1 CsgG/HfaB family protein [Candidatus Omnitrophota bacterium]MBU1889461.1 CsgG/HfaB family protein [Candidatus Omnitrophota bacterium]
MKNRIGKNAVMLALLFVCFVSLAGFTYAEQLTVAILNFDTKEVKELTAQDKSIGILGAKIADLLAVELSIDPNISLVERDKLGNILEEMGLGRTGILDAEQASKIGQMTGAQILVTGRAFTLERELVIIAKIVGTETSKVQVVLDKGNLSEDLTAIAKRLSQKVALVILEKGSTMIAKEPKKEEDKIQELKDKINNKDKPKVLVAISERHVTGGAIDPAAEQEFTYILNECDFIVASKKGLDLSGWAKEYLKDANLNMPVNIDANVIIVGEAFSEFGARTGNLISCKARVEIKAIQVRDKETHEILQTPQLLAIDRETNTAVDLSEQITAKTAIQEATANIAYRMIPKIVERWNNKNN